MAADGQRHVLAIGGGALLPLGAIPYNVQYAIELSGKTAPRLCVLNQAVGDDPAYYLRFYDRLADSPAEVRHLSLFPMPNVADPEDFLLSQDIIFVGGGSVANMLAVWRVHGLDEILRKAWHAGIVLAGGSAGGICWFEGGTTDSFGAQLRPFLDGLGLLAGSFCPHYNSEPRRRPLFKRLVSEGTLPGGLACDDGVGAHYVDDSLAAIVSDRPEGSAYRVEPDGAGGCTETRLPARFLGALPGAAAARGRRPAAGARGGRPAARAGGGRPRRAALLAVILQGSLDRAPATDRRYQAFPPARWVRSAVRAGARAPRLLGQNKGVTTDQDEPRTTNAGGPGWLLLIYRVPPEPTRLRSTVWRRIKSLGAIYLQNSVAALPASTVNERAFRKLRREITDMSGTAMLLSSTVLAGEADVLGAFQAARNDEYGEIADKCEDFLAGVQKEYDASHFTYAELEENEVDLVKLKNWFAKVSERDVFGASGRPAGEELIARCEQSLEAYAARVYAEEAEGPVMSGPARDQCNSS